MSKKTLRDSCGPTYGSLSFVNKISFEGFFVYILVKADPPSSINHSNESTNKVNISSIKNDNLKYVCLCTIVRARSVNSRTMVKPKQLVFFFSS